MAVCEAPGTETVPNSRWSVRCAGYSVLRSVAQTRPGSAGECSSAPQAGASAGRAGAACGRAFVQYRVSANG